MSAFLLIIILLQNLPILAQGNKDPNFIQFPFKGKVRLHNTESIKVTGLSYKNADSVNLFLKNPVLDNSNVAHSMIPIAINNINQLSENKHAFSKGAAIGLLLGYGAGYLFGWASYKDKNDYSDEDNSSSARTRGALFGIGSAIPAGLAGALLGGIFIRKRFTINGEQKKLTTALDKIYR